MLKKIEFRLAFLLRSFESFELTYKGVEKYATILFMCWNFVVAYF